MKAKPKANGPKLVRLTETNARQKWKITQSDLRKLRRLHRRFQESYDAVKEFENELKERIEIWSPIQSGSLVLKLKGGIYVDVCTYGDPPPHRDPKGRFLHRLFEDQPDEDDAA